MGLDRSTIGLGYTCASGNMQFLVTIATTQMLGCISYAEYFKCVKCREGESRQSARTMGGDRQLLSILG